MAANRAVRCANQRERKEVGTAMVALSLSSAGARPVVTLAAFKIFSIDVFASSHSTAT